MTALESSSTNQAAVLKAIKARLIDQIPEFTEKNLSISPEDDPPGGMRDEYFATLWILGGRFDEQAYDGGGIQQVHEYAGVTVNIWRRNPLDQAGQAENMLLDSGLGLLNLKKAVLKALLTQPRLEWERKFVLLEELRPGRSDHPREAGYRGGRYGDVYLEFVTPFAWDLS